MNSSARKPKQHIPESDVTNGQVDSDSLSVSLGRAASPNASDDGVIIATWVSRGFGDDWTFRDPRASPALPNPRPEPSQRQRRTHALVRGAETRAVRTRSRDIYTGDVPLGRLEGKLVSGEGLGEIFAWIVLEYFMENMTEAYAQADTVQISMFGVPTDWTPDGLVKRAGKRDLLFEVKVLEAVQPEPDTDPTVAAAMRERVRAMEAYAEATDRDFLLLTEHEIMKEPRFHNAKVMFRSLGANIGDEMLQAAMHRLLDLDEVLSVRDLADALPAYRNSMLMIACALDRAGHIRLDREDFFSPDVEFENYLSSRPQAVGS